MSQCILNATIQSHRHCCECVHTERRASSFRHARSHAFSSSKVTSSSSSFAGTSLRAGLSYKVVKKHQLNAEAVRCQATSEKMVIAITGRSSSVVRNQSAQEAHAQACTSQYRSNRSRRQQIGIQAFSSGPHSQSVDKEPRQGTRQASICTNQILQHTAAASRST